MISKWSLKLSEPGKEEAFQSEGIKLAWKANVIICIPGFLTCLILLIYYIQSYTKSKSHQGEWEIYITLIIIAGIIMNAICFKFKKLIKLRGLFLFSILWISLWELAFIRNARDMETQQ